MVSDHDTIAAIATPPGTGGVGIVRCSGTNVAAIADIIIGGLPQPRKAQYKKFTDDAGQLIDEGIAIYFPAPNSFTGEDVLELQGHGGMVVLDILLQAVIKTGARLAQPGEFSKRAFINGKMDLVQAEAIADLIASGSRQAARSAMRSLQGAFSEQINNLQQQLTALRTYIEGSIDFADEDVDFLGQIDLPDKVKNLLIAMDKLLDQARQGQRLHDGVSIVLAGAPNAGKSSLLNLLVQEDSAIVSPVPGTTRDLLRHYIHIDGLPVELIDTAGLHETDDVVESEGIRRARLAIEKADIIFWLFDDNDPIQADWQAHSGTFGLPGDRTMPIANKIDLSGKVAGETDGLLAISAKTGAGLHALHHYIKGQAGYEGAGETPFMARRRHIESLQCARQHLQNTGDGRLAIELLAEELRLTQQALGEITGEFTADDLLGQIFSQFCIGK